MIYGAALLAMLALGACSKSDSDQTTPSTPTTPTTPTDPEKRQISFTTRLEAMSGSTGEESLATGDTFTLVAFDGKEGSKSMDYTLGASALYWEDLSFAAEGGAVNFAACYPKQALTDGGFDFTVRQDAASDLMWASKAGAAVGSEQPVDLTFRHALHRLKVAYTVEDSSVDAAQIETRCTALATCRVDLVEQRLLQGDTRESYSALGAQAEFLLLPQGADAVTLEAKAGGTTQSWKLSETDFPTPELEGGKQATVHLTIRDGKITLSGLTIAGWDNQGTVEEEIIL